MKIVPSNIKSLDFSSYNNVSVLFSVRIQLFAFDLYCFILGNTTFIYWNWSM